MKKGLKLLALLLALFTVFSVVCSCTNSGTTDTTATQDTEAAQASSEIVIIKDGVCQYKLIRSDNLKDGSDELKAAMNLKSALKDLLADDQYVSIASDWVAKDATHDAEALEILVGNTNYDETATALEGVEGTAWAIKVIGNKICIVACTDDSLTKAVATFINLLKTNAKEGENGLNTVTLTKETLTLSGKVERPAASVPQPEGYTSIDFYKANLEKDEAIYSGVTREDYDKYFQKLLDAGYTVYSSTEMNGCPFATVYNGEYIINTGFYSNERRIRSIVEYYDESQLYGAESENTYNVVTTTQISTLGCAFTSNGSNYNTGACIVIRLCDGRFIIIDGGHVRGDELQNLVRFLKLQSKDYLAQTGGNITIAAWFVSHPHSDHWGPLVLNGTQSTLKSNKIVVQNLVYNFLSDEELALYRATNNEAGYSNSGDNSTLRNVAKKIGANNLTPHVGNTYYIANAKIEILFTIESYTDAVINDLNGVCPVVKYTFYDPTTKEEMNTFLNLNDATGYDIRTCANTFKTYLKSDICQVPHHGAGTKGDNGGVILGFSYALPETLLWTAGDGCYNAYAGNNYMQAALNKSQNPNFKEYFMSGFYNKAVILDLPYTAGNAKIIQY